jgi:hypothetical protein
MESRNEAQKAQKGKELGLLRLLRLFAAIPVSNSKLRLPRSRRGIYR